MKRRRGGTAQTAQQLQWNTSIVDTLGTWWSVLYSKVSSFQWKIYTEKAYFGTQ